jgi:MFS family permease
MIIRSKLAESPVFVELKMQGRVEEAPLQAIAKDGRMLVLKVIFMNWGVSTQSYTYQVFMASYLVTVVGVDPKFVPKVLLIGAICAAFAAFATGILSDRYGRRRVYLIITGALIFLPAPSFVALSTGSPVAITVVMILGFMLAAQGATGVQMSFFPEMFGNRYRYAGVTLGREFSSIIGGGVAPLICVSLFAAFAKSWVPVAIYMSVTMLVSFLVTRTVPETVNRDLNTPKDAEWGDARPLVGAR